MLKVSPHYEKEKREDEQTKSLQVVAKGKEYLDKPKEKGADGVVVVVPKAGFVKPKLKGAGEAPVEVVEDVVEDFGGAPKLNVDEGVSEEGLKLNGAGAVSDDEGLKLKVVEEGVVAEVDAVLVEKEKDGLGASAGLEGSP